MVVILNPDWPVLADGGTRRTLRERGFGFDTVQILIGAVAKAGRDPDRRGVRVEHANPRHVECTRLDRDPACLPEQLVTVVHAHDERIDSALHG